MNAALMTDLNEIFIERVNGLFVHYTLQNNLKWVCKCNQVNKKKKRKKRKEMAALYIWSGTTKCILLACKSKVDY